MQTAQGDGRSLTFVAKNKGGQQSMGNEGSNEGVIDSRSLLALSSVMRHFTNAGNDRLTVNQAAFFLIVAEADAAGTPMTASEVIDKSNGSLNVSLANTYKVLLEPSHKDYREIALGWLRQEIDLEDQRRKYLRLTEKGRGLVMQALKLASTPHNEHQPK
jgi:hypothetical protein